MLDWLSKELQLGNLINHRLRFGIPFEATESIDIPETPEGETVLSYVDKAEELQWKIDKDPGEPSSKVIQSFQYPIVHPQ